MKRFVSHYLYVPSYGFLKQYVVELNNNDFVIALYPLNEEIESIVWIPGVIRLVPYKYLNHGLNKDELIKRVTTFEQKELQSELFDEYDLSLLNLTAVRLYPFNFTCMEATTDTIFQVLGKCTY